MERNLIGKGNGGQHSRETVINNFPSSIRDIFLDSENDNVCDIDFSGMGRGNDFISNEEDDEIVSPTCTLPSNDNSIINLNDLHRDYFRRKLDENFSIKLSRGDVFWPRSIRNKHGE